MHYLIIFYILGHPQSNHVEGRGNSQGMKLVTEYLWAIKSIFTYNIYSMYYYIYLLY